MAVDSLRETRHINRIGTRDLGLLWSAQSYRPDITAALKKIRSMAWRQLAELCVNPVGPGPHPNFAPTGHPCLKTKNVLGIVVDASDVDFVEPSDATRWAHYCIDREDLVLNVTGAGSIGRVGMYFGDDRPITNQHLARLAIAPGTDAAFVCAFLSSWWGERALEQGVSGSTGQLNLVNDHVRQVPVPVPDTAAQRYIGDKVRQAERLRKRARRLDAHVRREYRAALDGLGYVEIPHRKSYRTRLRDRLDPAYYDPAFASVLDAPWLAKNSEPLSRFFSDGSYGDLPDSSTYGSGSGWLLRATDLDQCMTHWDAGIHVPRNEVGRKSEVKGGDVLLEVKGAIERCAIGRGPAVGKHVNGTVFRLSPTGINAGYLCLHLTSEIKRKYASREAVNNIIQYLNLECIRSLPVLRLGPDTEAKLGNAFLGAVDALTAATALTSAAKALVEELIEGHLTEADLVAAQKALEAGDRNRDRAILQALKQSDAAVARPLISDLDAAYALLDDQDGEKD